MKNCKIKQIINKYVFERNPLSKLSFYTYLSGFSMGFEETSCAFFDTCSNISSFVLYLVRSNTCVKNVESIYPFSMMNSSNNEKNMGRRLSTERTRY